MEFDADVDKVIETEVPLFFRKMARNALVQFATEKGSDRVTMPIYLEAKAKYMSSQSKKPDA